MAVHSEWYWVGRLSTYIKMKYKDLPEHEHKYAEEMLAEYEESNKANFKEV